MKHAIRRRPRAALLWGLALFAGLQLGLTAFMDRWWPELRDPEYGYKLERLRRQLAKFPGRPLLLALGSSRTQLAFRPDAVLAGLSDQAPVPVAFNFGLVGAGPVTELLCLRRLLDHGIRPDGLVVEVLPPLLHQEADWAEEKSMDLNRLGWEDWRRVGPYFTGSKHVYRRWRQGQWVPWFTHRRGILSRWAPCWLPEEDRRDQWRTYIDRSGWMARRASVTAAEYRHALDHARREYAPALQAFRVTEVADRAVRDLLELCRREGIPVLFVLAPEGREFQSWYPSAARAALEAYLTDLCRAWQVPLVDARSWVEDERFADGHHVLPAGAEVFSGRLGREVLRPLLEGERWVPPTPPSRDRGV